MCACRAKTLIFPHVAYIRTRQHQTAYLYENIEVFLAGGVDSIRLKVHAMRRAFETVPSTHLYANT